MGNSSEVATSNEYSAYGIDEIVHRVHVSGEVGPVWHGTSRCKESTQQHDTHNEEPHHEDSLLHGITVVGNNETQRGEKQG